jgi:hypothetical protein
MGCEVVCCVLAKFAHLESIPEDFREWGVHVANASSLAATLARERHRAMLFRTLATLRTDIDLFDDVEQLRWTGPTSAFGEISARLQIATSLMPLRA